MSSHSPAQEDTPLLHPTRDGETSQDESLNRHAPNPAHRTHLWLLVATVFGALVGGWLGFTALMVLAFANWGEKTNYYNFYSDVAFSTGFIAGFLIALYSLLELLWFGCSRRLSHARLDAVVFAVAALAFVSTAGTAILNRLIWREDPCAIVDEAELCRGAWWDDYLRFTWMILLLDVGLGLCNAYLAVLSMRRFGFKMRFGRDLLPRRRGAAAVDGEQPVLRPVVEEEV